MAGYEAKYLDPAMPKNIIIKFLFKYQLFNKIIYISMKLSTNLKNYEIILSNKLIV